MSYLVLFCSCVFSVLLVLRLPRLGKRELILVLFVHLFDLRFFGFVCFLFLLVSGNWEGLRLVPISILYKSIAGRCRPVRVANGPITVRYRFIKNASWV